MCTHMSYINFDDRLFYTIPHRRWDQKPQVYDQLRLLSPAG